MILDRIIVNSSVIKVDHAFGHASVDLDIQHDVAVTSFCDERSLDF